MAVTATSSSYHGNALMFQASKGFFNAVRQDNTLLNLIKASATGVSKEMVGGTAHYYYKGTALLKTNMLGGFRAEGGAAPSATNSNSDVMQWGLSLAWIRGQVSMTALDAGGLIGGATIEMLEHEGLVADGDKLLRDGIRGQSKGTLCYAIGAGTSATSLVVDDVDNLKVGMVIDSYPLSTESSNSDGSIEISAKEITAINTATKTVTIASSTWTAGSQVVRTGSKSYAWNGIRDLINDGDRYIIGDMTGADDYLIQRGIVTYANLSRTTYAGLRANIYAPNESVSGTLNAGATHTLTLAEPKMVWIDRLAAQHIVKSGMQADWSVGLCHPYTYATLVDLVRGSMQVMKSMDAGKLIWNEGSAELTYVNPLLKKGRVVIKPVPFYTQYVLDFIDVGSDLTGGVPNIGIRWVVEPQFIPEPGGIGGMWKSNKNEYSGYDTATCSWGTTGNLVGNPLRHGSIMGIKPMAGLV